MWELRNKTPFAAKACFERDQNGNEAWCLMVKATFDLADGELMRTSQEQAEIALAPEYCGPDASELQYETDVIPFSPGTELIITGTVHPRDDASSPHKLSLQLGPIEKTAWLHPPIKLLKSSDGWNVISPEPLLPTDLNWRGSYGGTDGDNRVDSNPIGRGFSLPSDTETPLEAPVLLRDQTNFDPASPPSPVGFSPIPRHWQPRLGFAGTYDAQWQSTRAPLLPVDFDPRFHRSAPVDQCTDTPLKGGERLKMLGFLPDHPVNVLLPQVILSAQIHVQRQTYAPAFSLARVTVDLNSRQVALLWVANQPCGGFEEHIDLAYIRLKQSSGILT